MSSKLKHAKRSQRSHRQGIPLGIFYYHAEADRNARYNRNINKAMNTLYDEELNGKKED